jgi:hypothetical protein
MVKSRIKDINGSGGDFIAIAATWTIRRMVVTESLLKEDGSANVPQGLDYRKRNDGTAAGFTTVFEIGPMTDPDSVAQQIVLGTQTDSAYNGIGETIGTGPQPLVGGSQDGTHMVDLRSATATATSVVIEEEV